MIAEGDRVAARNHWTATDSHTGRKLEFSGIVIWRLRRGRLWSAGVFASAARGVDGAEQRRDSQPVQNAKNDGYLKLAAATVKRAESQS